MNKFEISDIIAKHYMGICIASEEEVLMKWLLEKSENQTLYDHIINDIKISNKINDYLSYDTEKSFQKVKSQLLERKKVKLYKRVFRYAAIFILPIIAGGLVYWYLNFHQSDGFDQKGDLISAGSSKAILKMSDGTIIALEEQTFKNIERKDGTLISNDAKTIRFTSASNSESDVKLKSNIATTKSLAVPVTVYEEIIIPRGGEFHLILPDGTNVWLNSETTFEFPSQFIGEVRKVNLKSGEAYFEVTENKQMPFIVKVEQMDVKVLGTSFNVSAYKNDAFIKTTLVEGQVQLLSNPLDSDSTELILSPGEQGSFSSEDKTFVKKKVDTKFYTSWKNGEFVFENSNIVDVLKKLSRWYDFDFIIENQNVANYHFTGTLKRYEDISVLIDLIQYTSNIKFNIKDSTIYVN